MLNLLAIQIWQSLSDTYYEEGVKQTWRQLLVDKQKKTSLEKLINSREWGREREKKLCKYLLIIICGEKQI